MRDVVLQFRGMVGRLGENLAVFLACLFELETIVVSSSDPDLCNKP